MVQTFIVEESKELIYENDKIQEWKDKCEALGLNKQIALTNEERSPIPFEFMNTVSRRVYETLCPCKGDYKDYCKTAIPLEVLGLIQLSVSEGYFKKIMIWYDDKTPDPLVVGSKPRDEYEWNNELYLIARWGDALRPFEELKKMAIKVFKNTQRIAMQKKLAEIKQKIDMLDLNAEAYFDAQIESYEATLF